MGSHSTLQEWSDWFSHAGLEAVSRGLETLSQPEDPRKSPFLGVRSRGLWSSLDSVANVSSDPVRTLPLLASVSSPHTPAQYKGEQACLPGLLNFIVCIYVTRHQGWVRPWVHQVAGGQALTVWRGPPGPAGAMCSGPMAGAVLCRTPSYSYF